MTDDSSNSPEDVFADACAALNAGDAVRFFNDLDRADILKIANNSVRALASVDPEFDEVCARHGFDAGALTRMRELADLMTASAQRLATDPGSYDSDAHHEMVKGYESAIKDGFRPVADLPAFAAALEDRMHARMGGGSVSTSLFEGESLADIEIDGKKAWATRMLGTDEVDDIGFVRKRDGWKIKLFARRPAR